MSTLLGCGPHHARYSFGHPLPLRFFDQQLLSAFIRKSVILEFPIAIRRCHSFRDNPSSSRGDFETTHPLLEAMQGGIE
jgi:hypothetical protein